MNKPLGSISNNINEFEKSLKSPGARVCGGIGSQKWPKYIYRKDDNMRFTLGADGFYTMDKSEMVPKYQYTLKRLSGDEFTLVPGRLNIKDKFEARNDGHGNEYD